MKPINKRVVSLAAVLALGLGALLKLSGAGARTLEPEDLFTIPRLSQLAVSPDGSRAAFVVKKFDMEANSGASSLWIADFTSKKVRQLTNSVASDWSPAWRGDDEVVFLSTRSAKVQLWSISTVGGEALQLTDWPVPISHFVLAPDQKHAAVVAEVYPTCDTLACNREKAEAEEKNPVKARIYTELLYRIWDTWRDERRGHVLWTELGSKAEPRDLTPGAFQTPPLDLGGYSDLSISPDSKEVAFTANVTKNPAWNTNNDIFVVPVSGAKKPRNLTEDKEGGDAEPIYSPDGQYLAYVSVERPGFEADRRVVFLYDRETGVHAPLTGSLDRTVSQLAWRPDGQEIVFNAYDRGRKAVYRVTVPGGEISKIVEDHTNSFPQFARGGDAVAFLQESASEPAELFIAEKGGAAEPERITRLTAPALEGVELGTLQEFTFKGAKGDEVHGFELLPPNFNPKKKYPLLLLIHGGPQGAFGDNFHPRWNLQMFAIPGFVVAAVNFHGSKGYGQKFCDAVSKDWGGAPYEDLMKGVDHLVAERKYLSDDNVSAAGASYGAFMINWILGHTDRFRSLVSHDGVFEQLSMYGATEELWFPEWEFGGTPYENPELFEKFSPMRHAKNFKTPTLVVHGEHDYRVPYTQGLQLFTALQRQGVESKLLFFPDENHFVQKPQNARLWWRTVLGWLADHADLKWAPEKSEKNARKKGVKKIAG